MGSQDLDTWVNNPWLITVVSPQFLGKLGTPSFHGLSLTPWRLKNMGGLGWRIEGLFHPRISWDYKLQSIDFLPDFFSGGPKVVSKVVSTHRTGTHPEKTFTNGL